MFRIRWMPTVVVLLLALGILFGGWSLYQTFGLVHPLQNELKANPAVSAVSFDLSGRKRAITITLNQVDDLRTTYSVLSDEIKTSLGEDCVIEIKSNPSKELKKLYEGYEPSLYEGVAKKSYVEMVDSIQKRGQADHLSLSRVTMDRQNVYVQLEKGSDYLYQVIPYTISGSDNVDLTAAQ